MQIDTLTLEQAQAAMAQLRARLRELKGSGKRAQRKIATLTRRRERLIAQVNAIDDQITQLRGAATVPDAPPAPRRGRPRRSSAV